MQVRGLQGFGRRELIAMLAATALLAAALVGLLWRNSPSNAPESGAEPAESPSIEVESLRAGPNLVLVTLDTLRADRLGSYGYEAAETPHLDRLAVRFEQVVSPVPATLPAHASILTGQNPYRHKVRDNGTFQLQDDALTLAEILDDAGYATAGFIAAFVLDAQFGTAQGFDEYTDFGDQEVAEAASPFPNVERKGGEVVEEAVEWLQQRTGPFFAWVHLYDPHDPYAPPEPYRTRYRQRPYDGEIAYTDEVVGRLLAGLEAAGHDRDTLLVVVADHGEGLGDHGESMHGFFVYDTTVRVPLILWAKDALPAGVVVAGQARLIDILPTALALLGVSDPAPSIRDGVDIRALISAPEAPGHAAYSEAFLPLLLFGWSELRSLRADGFKYIAAPRPELYDLRADPDETTNLLAVEPRLAATMRADLEELVAGDDDPTEFAAGRRPLDAATFERLRSLGYVGGGAGVSDDRDVDPKDRVELFQDFTNRVNVVFTAAADERWDEAAAELEVLERLAPNHFSVQHGLGLVALAQGNVEEAVRRLEQALSLNPSYSPTLIQLSKAYQAAGQPERAVALLREGMHSFPDVFSFPFELGGLYHLAGRLDEALEVYRVAVDMQPRNPVLLRSMAHLYLSRREPREALGKLETLVEEAPDDPEAWGNLGMVLGGLGEFPRAEAAFRRGLSLAPDIPTMHFNLGLVLLRQGDRQGAADSFRSALRLDPSFEPARQQLARIGMGGE